MNDKSITTKDLNRFIDFFHSPFFEGFSREEQHSFISICRLLGNERLTLLLIESLRKQSEVEGGKVEECCEMTSESKDIYFEDFEVNHFASNFHCYSIELLRCLDKTTLHNIIKSPFLKLADEDVFLKLLIELGSDYKGFLSYIDIVHLTGDGLSLFVDHLEFDDLTESIWHQIIARLKNDTLIALSSDRYVPGVIGFESLILDSYPKILKEFGKKTWTLLYRGSRDGFKPSNFHSKCDKESNTVTLIETTKGFIFGGFTPIPWDSSSGYKSDPSEKSFIFTLKNANNISPRAFKLSSASVAILCNSAYGPTFGNGHDIHLYNDFTINSNNYTNVGIAYVNDTGIAGTRLFTGEECFTVKEMEIFAIIP
jgi:hypothetical protein